MISQPLRLVLILLALAAAWSQRGSGHWSGLVYVVLAGVLVHGGLRYGPVWLAFRTLRLGQLERAGRLLDQVLRPDWLAPGQRAAYELARGLVAVHHGDAEGAERHLRAARDHERSTDTNRCLAESELARLAAARGDRDQARDLLASARARQPGPELAGHLERLADLLEAEDGDGS